MGPERRPKGLKIAKLVGMTLIILILLPAWAVYSTTEPVSSMVLQSTVKKELDRWHGMNLEGYSLKHGVIKLGQTLSTLLKPHGVPFSVVLQAERRSSGVFDVRRFKPSRHYTVVRDPTRGNKVRFLLYDLDVKTYVVFDLGKTLSVYKGSKALAVLAKNLHGTIQTSLWEALVEQHADPKLLDSLGELFSGKIDFRKLRAGERYWVLYEAQYNGDRQVSPGVIKAAILSFGGEIHQAFQFNHHGKTDYYDEGGLNLQTAFMASPLKYDRVSSGFSEKRLHPLKKIYQRHPAIDYAASAGTPVMSVGNGRVRDIGYSSTAGNFITIRHPGRYESSYLHLSGVAKGITINDRVEKGDVIGFVGSTGLSTGPHLDFRFLSNGMYVDFTQADLPAGESVDAQCMDRFKELVDRYHTLLAFNREPDRGLLTKMSPSRSSIQQSETQGH
jgi:murein DD-endopeptidase MepM/ murein hydrolase activator NlpD